MAVNVNRDWADVVLLLCYIITGLLDSSSISIWGSFVSMQTGKMMLPSVFLDVKYKIPDRLTLDALDRKHGLHWPWAGCAV